MCPDLPESGFAGVKLIDLVLFAEGTKKIVRICRSYGLPESGFGGVNCTRMTEDLRSE